MVYRSINPYNGELLATFEEQSDQEVELILARAEDCFARVWRRAAYAERAAVLRRAAERLRADQEKFARLATLEMGKLLEEGRGEVIICADILDYYAENGERFLAPERLTTPLGEATVESSPLGVLLGIEPWNFPYYQVIRFVAPNLMAGNVTLVKPAPSVPQCAIALAQLFEQAGAPSGAYTNLFISNEQIARVIADPRVRGVALTGSERAGSAVGAAAGQHLKKSTLELGGSDAFIVLEDADLEKTVEWAVWGRMITSGQTCIAAKRFIVVEELAEGFLERFRIAFEALVPGDPLDASTTLAPLSSEEALNRLLEQVEQAVEQGARVVTGGKRLSRSGAFMQPTILTEIKPDNIACREEFFGPVALFFPVRNENEAVALANDSRFGLGGAVFTADVERGRRLARRIESGMVFINHPTLTGANLPFGGVKNSGYGRELSNLGIQEFVNKKLIYSLPIEAPAY
jgi:succinate-semialdehyde dehydrogenase/glutarate-semialdehyde dehydrogenase